MQGAVHGSHRVSPEVAADQTQLKHSLDRSLITLAMKDHTITIPSADIPDPPPLYSHGSIEFINGIWDDNPATWNHSSPLRINGISIPLVYWRAIYSYRRSKQWSGLKQRWSEFRVRHSVYRESPMANVDV